MSKMIIRKYLLFCVLAFFISGAFFIAPLNAQDVATLDNGLKLVIREDHRNPIAVFSVFVDTGSASEGEYAGSGISHLIEHMLFKGTKKYSVGAIEDILHRYGGEIEGYTSYDYTGYSITILKEHSDLALDILKEMLTAPVFDRSELKKEMTVIEREMDLNKDDPARRLHRMVFQTAFLEHPYRLPAIGYKGNFKNLKRDDIVRFFKTRYSPDKMTIAVVGDIDRQSMLDKISQAFGRIPRGPVMDIVRSQEPLQAIPRFLEEKADIDGAYLNMSFHSTSLLNKDIYAMDLLSFILGQGDSSILNENLRMKNQLVLSISAYNYTPKDPGLFIISSILKEENVPGTIEAILSRIENIKTSGVQEEDLSKAKNNFIAGYIYQKETIESQANDMAQSQILTGSPDFFKEYVENIKSVRAEDIKAAAVKYLNRENMSVVVLSKSGNALKFYSGKALEKQELAVNKILLKNNIPVIISENHSLPVIAVSIVFKAGVRSEDENNNGISMLISQMLMDGTNSMSRSDIAKLYESKAITLNTYSGNNSIGITAGCLREHIEDTIRLASEICTEPSFPEEEFKREKNELSQAIDMQDNDILNHGQRLLKQLLFQIHPYRFQTIGSHESIDKITKEEIINFYKDIVSADNIVIGISGDCKTDEIAGIVEKYFSKIPSRGQACLSPTKEPPINKVRGKIVQVDKNQSLILIGFQGIEIYDKDKYNVEVLVNILSSPSGVLFKNIREERALTYAIGAFNVPGIDPGYIAVYGLTSKENIAKVKERILKQLDLLIKNGPSDEAINKSKNHLKAMRKIGMQTNASFIFNSSMDELYGLGYENYKDFDKKIDSVTKEDVKRAAKRFLTLDKYAVVILEGK